MCVIENEFYIIFYVNVLSVNNENWSFVDGYWYMKLKRIVKKFFINFIKFLKM